jgi:hypothetical protein
VIDLTPCDGISGGILFVVRHSAGQTCTPQLDIVR